MNYIKPKLIVIAKVVGLNFEAISKNKKDFYNFFKITAKDMFDFYCAHNPRPDGYREGEDWITRKFPGAEHSEWAWRERVHIPLLFLLEGQST